MCALQLSAQQICYSHAKTNPTVSFNLSASCNEHRPASFFDCRYETSSSNVSDKYYVLGLQLPDIGQPFTPSLISLVSTAESTRGQLLCNPIQVPARVHRGDGDISMGPDRQLYISGFNHLHKVNINPTTLCPVSITKDVVAFP